MAENSPAALVHTLYHQLAALPAWHEIADTDAIVEAALTIQQIPAPTFAEAQRARYVHDQMVALGLAEVQLDALHNVYGCLPGRRAGPGILISAHTDTVFAQDVNLTVRRDGQRIYGPGLSDNSISVAALLHLARVLKQHQLQTDHTLWFVANTGEEGLGDLAGMRAVINHLHHKVGAVVVVDAQFGTVVHAGVASRRYRISVAAAGGHSWQDWGAPSAVHVLVRLGARLTELAVSVDPKSTFNIGVIEGGTTVNAIAQHASLLLDLRSVDEARLAALIAQVETIVADVTAEERGVTVRLETVGDRPGGSIERQHPLAQLASAAYMAVGANVIFDAASTDANVPLSRAIPAVCIGMSRGGNAHRLDEYLEIDDIPAGMRSLLLLTLAAASATTA